MASRETLSIEPLWLLMTLPFNPKIHLHRKVSTVLEGLRAARLHPQPEPSQLGIPNPVPLAPALSTAPAICRFSSQRNTSSRSTSRPPKLLDSNFLRRCRLAPTR